MENNRRNDLEKGILRVSSTCEDPEKLLNYFKSLPKPTDERKIESMVLTMNWEQLLKRFADLGYHEAGEELLKYAQETDLTSEKTACVYVLGKLGYDPARGFIEKTLDQSCRSYNKYKTDARDNDDAGNQPIIHLTRKLIVASIIALDSLKRTR